ncbi:hypothetical protein ASPFODRAFT_702000, partial [Aspergillus luchuensis CBS 106.47]
TPFCRGFDSQQRTGARAFPFSDERQIAPHAFSLPKYSQKVFPSHLARVDEPSLEIPSASIELPWWLVVHPEFSLVVPALRKLFIMAILARSRYTYCMHPLHVHHHHRHVGDVLHDMGKGCTVHGPRVIGGPNWVMMRDTVGIR